MAKGLKQTPSCPPAILAPARHCRARPHGRDMPSRRCCRVRSGKGQKNDLLDFITAGAKMRKWYGEGDLPADGSVESVDLDEVSSDETQGDAVLVLSADSGLGEQIVLQLILARANIRVLAPDPSSMRTAYGPYVAPIAGDAGNAQSVAQALKGARAVIVPGRLGSLMPLAARAGVEHIVMLSTVGTGRGGHLLWGGLLADEHAVLRDEGREAALRSANVPYTIARVPCIRNIPGGATDLLLSEGAKEAPGEISQEDAARVAALALTRIPRRALTFTVTRGGSPSSDLAAVLAELREVDSTSAV